MANIPVTAELVAILQRTGDYKILRRLPFISNITPPDPLWKRAVIIDTETTGLDTATCKIIEIALLEIFFDEHDEVAGAGASYCGLQDPGEPLSDDVKRVTGLTDADLTGQKINWQRVDEILKAANVIIAHNAGFDRPIVEREWPSAANKAWACSSEELPWKDIGCPSRALECIAWFLGYFYTAHRAGSDVEALAGILSIHRNAIEGSFLQELIQSARMPTQRVRAIGSPFEMKDALKARGYKWDQDRKHWFKDLRSDAETEMAWLRDNAKCRPEMDIFTATKRYKAGV